MRLINRISKNNKGSTLLVVIILVFILSILSMTALSMAFSNMKMANKSKVSSKEYYNLEKTQEEIIGFIDNKLEKNEETALNYMKEEKYNNEYYYSDLKYSSNQSFFYNRWKEFVDKPSKVKSFDLYGNAKEITDSDKYNELVDKFFQGAFSRVYLNLISKDLNNMENEIKTFVRNMSSNNKLGCTIKVFEKKDYGNIGNYMDWDLYEPSEDDITIKIEVEDKEKKTLTSVCKIKAPIYGSMTNDKNVAVQGNPIWSNAIIAHDNIKFQCSKNNIYGDIFSANKSLDNKGIQLEDSKVNIYGNVYSHGDFNITKGKSEVNVYKYPNTVKRDLKDLIYDKNKVFFKKNNDKIFPQNLKVDDYIEGTVPLSENYIPFIFKDYNGGNVYCNNLSIQNAAMESKILVGNNLLTKDDVINNSKEGSAITIGGNYLGITPVDRDNDDGSCIVNNIYKDNNLNKIVLNGKFIVPGKRIITDKRGYKYQTVESISANTWTKEEFLKPYSSALMTPWSDWGNQYSFYINKKNIITNLIPDTKADYFRTYIKNEEQTSTDKKSLPKGATNIIYNNPEVEGYAAGAVIFKINNTYKCFGGEYPYEDAETRVETDTFSSQNFIKNNWKNKEKLQLLTKNKALNSIFESKTSYLGLNNVNLTNLVNKNVLLDDKGVLVDEKHSGIRYLKDSNNDITINGNEEGIIYSEGNVNIYGSGKFRGTIISEGNVNVLGDVDIYYDEDVIFKILQDKNNPYAKKFFKPGQIGNILFNETYKTNNVRARKVISKDRYKISQWKQGKK